MDRVGDLRGGEAVLDGETELVDDFTGVRRDDARPKEDTVLVGDDFDETVHSVTDIGAADDVDRDDRSFDLQVAFETVFFRPTDTRNLRG